jgi:RNA polymerase sigma-70 factor (ECF subfamily)
LLYGLALRLLGNAADTEDVLQETFAGAFRGLRGFREQSSVKTWLTQILFRQASKLYRSEQRRRRITFDAQSAGRTPPAPQGRADARMDLAEAILALRPEHREVIVLRELQALSYDEIAAILGVPRGTVESRLFRARRELQELLKDYLP